MVIKLVIIIALSAAVLAERVRYDNYTLYRIHPDNEDHVEFLKDLQRNNNGLNFWNEPSHVGDFVSVVSPPELRDEFEHTLSKRSIFSEVVLENIETAYESQIYSRRKRDTDRQLYWDGYQTRESINEWFRHLAETYSNIVTVVTAGKSHEGRDITGIRISRGSGRRAFFLEGGQIGADWLSPVVLTYIVNQLVTGEDPEARAASEQFDWYIFPLVNPDGHEYTQAVDRFWIKNRRPTSGSNVGVDLTRNWNSHWGVRGGSFNAQDNNYIGRGPFSEPETRELSKYIMSIADNLVGLLSFRAFGQRLVIPFAYAQGPMSNYDEMITIGRRAMGSLAVRYNTQYLVGNSMAVSDGATGNIADWAKTRFNLPIVATYLLRDTGSAGYTLHANQVQPSCEETFDSLMALLREARFINVL